MNIINIAVHLFYCASLRSIIYCKTFDDTSQLARQQKHITSDVHPRLNQNEFVKVSITAFIASILDYNEVSGTLQTVVSYYLTWADELRRWNSSAYGNASSMNLQITSTLISEISVNNMVRQKNILMYHNYMAIRKAYVNYKSDGSAVFLLGGAQELSCSSNVKYFPFDSHACSIELVTTHALDNVIITSAIKTMDLTYGVPNPKWSITENVVQSNVYVYTSKVSFNITLSRNPSFLFLNLVLPIVLLSFSNLLVFCIPAASGERGSLAFTILLTFVVFITQVTAILPACKPISHFNIFLEVQLFYSVSITFCAVWSISLHHKFVENVTQENCPRFVLQMSCAYRNLGSTKQRKVDNKRILPPRGFTEEQSNDTSLEKSAQLPKEQQLHEDNKNESKFTKDIHQYCLPFIDSICFSLFLIILCIQLIVPGIIFSSKS